MSDDFVYIGLNGDGDAVAIVVDDPKYKRDTARTIASWIRDGRTVERVTRSIGCERLRSTHEKRRETAQSAVQPTEPS